MACPSLSSLLPSLPSHALAELILQEAGAGYPARLSGSGIRFLVPRPAPTPRPLSARRVPVVLWFSREWCGQDAGLRLAHSSMLPRALGHPGSGVSTFPTEKRGRTPALREEKAATAVQEGAPGREGCRAEGRESYQRPMARASLGWGGRPAPPTWRPPPRLHEGSVPAGSHRSRLAPPHRLPQRPLPLSGQPVQTNGIPWAVLWLANR